MKNIMGSDHRPGRDSKFVAGSKPIYARSRIKRNNKSITYSQNGSVYDEENRRIVHVLRHASRFRSEVGIIYVDFVDCNLA